MKRTLLLTLLFSLMLTACSLPMPRVSNPTASSDQIQTQVSELLTQVPGTKSVSVEATPTIGSVTVLPTVATIAPSDTPEPTETQLPTVTSEPSATPTAAETSAAGTGTPNAASTMEATGTPGATVTAPATDPKLLLGNPTFQDTFADDKNWPTGSDTFTDIQIANNTLTLTGLTKKDGWRLNWSLVKNFYAEITVKTGECKGTDRYGIFFRVPNRLLANSGYMFGVTCDGQYSLRKWNGDKMINIIPWTASTAIQSGSNQTNRLGVLTSGSHITLYVNGVQLKAADDTSYTEGGIGLFVGGNQTPKFKIMVTDFSVWDDAKP